MGDSAGKHRRLRGEKHDAASVDALFPEDAPDSFSEKEPTAWGRESAQPEVAYQRMKGQIARRRNPKPLRRRLGAWFLLMLLVVGFLAGLFYTQPWSAVEVVIVNPLPSRIGVIVLVDDVPQFETLVLSVNSSCVALRVTQGVHVISVDVACESVGIDMDGTPDWSCTLRVGPLGHEHLEIDLGECL